MPHFHFKLDHFHCLRGPKKKKEGSIKKKARQSAAATNVAVHTENYSEIRRGEQERTRFDAVSELY